MYSNVFTPTAVISSYSVSLLLPPPPPSPLPRPWSFQITWLHVGKILGVAFPDSRGDVAASGFDKIGQYSICQGNSICYGKQSTVMAANLLLTAPQRYLHWAIIILFLYLRIYRFKSAISIFPSLFTFAPHWCHP